MRMIAKITCVGILSALCIGTPLYSLSEEDVSDTARLIKEAKIYIQEGNKEKAVAALDVAFRSADAAGDCNALMEIGDLYIRIDKSLNDKAMNAWLAAGRWKSR